ncbi:MAG TPA: hypothetical protein VG318_19020 [Actinomycetota bacterium]|nr:hypothetical protein [Actinomycetota bacterium]
MRRILLLALTAAVACTSAPDEAAVDTAAPSPSAAPTLSAPAGQCPNQSAAVADTSLRTGDARTGDVDGDGVDEEVAVHFDPSGDPGCQAFVVADSAEETLAAPLETWRTDFGLPAPTLNTLEDVDGEPGLEVVVNMGAGASAQFVGIVAADGGTLQQVTVEAGDNTVGDGLLGFGGSVGHVEAVDCAPDGGIVSSFAAPEGSTYRVERRFLVFEGTTLVEDRVEVENAPLEEIDRFPEYAASPFGSCSG